MIEEIKEIILEQLDVNENEITKDSRLIEDLGADSLDLAEIVVAVETKYNIEIEKENVEKIKTIKDILDYINKKG